MFYIFVHISILYTCTFILIGLIFLLFLLAVTNCSNSEFGSTMSIPDQPSTPVFTQTASANLISAIVQSPGHRSSPSSLILPTPGDKRNKALATGKGTMKRLKERMKHNIPHRFTIGLSMRGTKCSACADTIHFGRQVAKCQGE